MVRLFAEDYTLAEYRAHLGCMLGLLEPLERVVCQAAGANQSLSTLERSKDLYDDLSIMGSSADEIDAFERCPYVPSLPAAGLPGYLYVKLGSMLGGEIIVRRFSAATRAIVSTAAVNLKATSLAGHRSAPISKSAAKRMSTPFEPQAVEIFDLYAAWLSEPNQRPGRLC
jgi:hypothetical protein